MNLKLLFPISIFLVLPACSTLDTHSQNVDLKIQHDILAKHFEDEANEIQSRVDEHKKLLGQFKTKSYVYGKHADELKSHSQEVIDSYEKIAIDNRKMAQIFREMEP